MIGKVDDHTLVLQLERQYEVIEERVKDVEEYQGDDYCDCNCHEADVSHLEDLIEHLQQCIEGLEARIFALEEAD